MLVGFCAIFLYCVCVFFTLFFVAIFGFFSCSLWKKYSSSSNNNNVNERTTVWGPNTRKNRLCFWIWEVVARFLEKLVFSNFFLSCWSVRLSFLFSYSFHLSGKKLGWVLTFLYTVFLCEDVKFFQYFSFHLDLLLHLCLLSIFISLFSSIDFLRFISLSSFRELLS